MTLIQMLRRWPSAFQQKIRQVEFALIELELQCLRMLYLVAQAVKKALKVNARLVELMHLECSSLSCSIRTTTHKRQRRHGRPKYISATGNHSTKPSITATTLIWTDLLKVWTTTRTSLQTSKKCCVITQIWSKLKVITWQKDRSRITLCWKHNRTHQWQSSHTFSCSFIYL